MKSHNAKMTWRVLMTQTFGKPRNDFETPEKKEAKKKRSGQVTCSPFYLLFK
jgi:hypothetical protein